MWELPSAFVHAVEPGDPAGEPAVAARQEPRDDARPATWQSLAVVVVAVLVPAVAFATAFPERTDYLGHYLAGAGGTALVLAAVLAARGRRPWMVAGGTVAAILAGVGTEATVFRLAIFDPVDLANQSLGALVVGAGLIGAVGAKRLAAGLTAVALLLLGAGFRYAFA